MRDSSPGLFVKVVPQIQQQKYRLLRSEFRDVGAVRLYRVVALRNFGRAGKLVKAGQKGGFVQSWNNLSQEGWAWVDGDAWVDEEAQVVDDAWVRGRARLSGRAIVADDAVIDDDAIAIGGTWFRGNTRVRGRSWVSTATITDSVVTNSEIGDNAKIEGSLVLRSVIGTGSVIRWSEIKDSLIDPSTRIIEREISGHNECSAIIAVNKWLAMHTRSDPAAG